MPCHREVFNFNAVRFSLGFYLRVGLDKDRSGALVNPVVAIVG